MNSRPSSSPPSHRPAKRAGVLATLAAALLAWQATGHAQTADAAAAAPGVGLSTMLQTFAILAAILAVFVGAAWLLRRLNGGRGLIGGNGPMHVVGNLPVGPRERIVLIEIEDTWLVVGIAPGQMRTLHAMPKGTLPVPPGGGDGQFAHWLRQFRDLSKNAKD